MTWYQQKGDHLQEFNFKFSELIQAVSNKDPSMIMNPLEIAMYF